MAVSTRRRPMTNVEADLDAASAPLAVESVAGEPRLHRSHAERMQALIASGMAPEQAMQVAGRQVVEAETAAGQARADARVQSGYRDPRQTAYNADTFADGYGFDESGNPAFLGEVDIDNTGSQGPSARAAREYNARDPRGAEVALSDLPHPGRQVPADPPRALGRKAPGPRTLDGRPPAMSQPLMTPEDVEAYDVRPPNGLSQRDRDMALRGMVPVVTPNGVSYMRAAGDTQTIGGPGRAGSRPDLLTKKDPEQQWAVSELGEYMGPDGKPVSVLVPGPQMREKQAADLAERQAAYQTRKVASEEDFQSRRAHRLALAKLAGGSQNINSGNRWMAEALLAMTPEQRSSSMRYMLPGGDRAAAVDAGGARNAMRMMDAEALTGMDPARQEERRAARVTAESGLPPAQRARISIANGEQMGEGGSAGHVADRWNYWTNTVIFPREQGAREQKFKQDMEILGYQPAQIDAWIKQRRGEAEPLPMEAAPPGGYAEGPTTSL